MKRCMWLAALLSALVLIGAACSSDGDDSASDDAESSSDGDGAGDGADGDGAADADGSDGADDGDADGSGDDSSSSTTEAPDTGPDDDDAAEILGDPDLDLDELPDDAADALDEIDDVVSIGDCQSDVLGLMAMPPNDEWQCRVLDQSLGGLDGFTLFREGNELNITIGTPIPGLNACDVLPGCSEAPAIELSDNFPDTVLVDLAGTQTIIGTHATGAELSITKLSAITDDELDLIRQYLDSVAPL